VALADTGDAVTAAMLPPHLLGDHVPPAEHAPAPTVPQAAPLQAMTRHALDEALKACDHDVAKAARRLGIHRSTIYRHLARQRGKPAGD